MGREIRRVPPNWQHPEKERFSFSTGRWEKSYQPLYDRTCEEAWEDWKEEYEKWIREEHDRVIADYGEEKYPKDQPYTSFCKWHGTPPTPEYYHPKWKEEATWWQVYETVSEGTPVTPPFATQEELVDYLVANGDFWDQKRREEGCTTMDCSPWSRKAAEKFVYGSGWAPSFILTSKGLQSGVEAMGAGD